MLKRYERCWLLCFPAFGKWKIEFVFAPPGYEIKPHTHPNQNIKLMLLFGHNVVFHRQKKGEFLGETYMARLKDIGKVFTINAGDIHYFTVSRFPLLFVNFESWKTTPTSASIDIQYEKT